MPELADSELDAFRERLVARRAELTALRDKSRNERSAVELDQSRVGRLSRMDALQSQAISAEADRRRQVELARIAAALTRIDEGTFGACAGCEEDIDPKRLTHDPSVPLCLPCARGQG